MSKITGFFDGLKKSTKVTVLSCGSFVIMTVLILAFFMLFPITPSERVMDNIGRENISQDSGQGPVQSGVPSVETTASTEQAAKTTTTKVTTTRSRTSFTITITTGSGFMWNGRIPTGGIPGWTETTTTAADQPEPYEDPSGNTDPTGGTEPVTGGGYVEPTTGGGGDEPTTGGNSEPDPVVATGQANPEPSVTPGNGGDSSGGGGASSW